MQYESLENEIQAKGVEVISMRFRGTLKGLYADNTIFINTKLETNAEKCCILAEEIGHHYTTTGDITDQSKVENRKQEKQARNWGYEELVGIMNIIKAFNAGTRNRYEMAEYLDVTEEFLEESIKHYKEKYGLFFEIDEYIVYFDPHFGVMKKF